MYVYKEFCQRQITAALVTLFENAGVTEAPDAASIIPEIPPKPEMGDLGFPMFLFAKTLKKGPPQIASMLAEILSKNNDDGANIEASYSAEGPYLNVRFKRGPAAIAVLEKILSGSSSKAAPAAAAHPGSLSGKRFMVEYSSPNTNKPLHLGHLRNDVLGESISRILEAAGAEVRRVCIINDRGIHICKSMLAYKKHGAGCTPESAGVKSDRFVGDYYVAFSNELKTQTEELMKEKGIPKEEAEAAAPIMNEVRQMLLLWESGDPETMELWKKMNKWAVDGMMKTYDRTGIRFDQFYYESQTYLLGKDEILKGLEQGIFFRAEDGSVQIDLTAEKLEKKVLLRKDGTSIYITQDLGTAIYRHKDWPFDRLIYVVGSEQQYHFKVLFSILGKLNFPWAKDLYHLSYGMVRLPEGKMKSREGTVVDADDLIDSLRDLALEEIREKNREEAVGDSLTTAEKIALGALHYYLLQVSPVKDMLFDPKESLSFNGNTGPYLQYMGARISSLIRKAGKLAEIEGDFSLLVSDAEWELVKILSSYDEAVLVAAENIDPSALAAYLYELSKAFSRFYQECPILDAENPMLSAARISLSKAVLKILKEALNLVCIPFLEIM